MVESDPLRRQLLAKGGEIPNLERDVIEDTTRGADNRLLSAALILGAVAVRRKFRETAKPMNMCGVQRVTSGPSVPG